MLFFLSETLDTDTGTRMYALKSTLGFDECFSLSCNGRKGGVCLMWSSNLTVQILDANQSMIHAYISTISQQQPWFFTGVNGPPQPSARCDIWKNFNTTIPAHNLPWILMRDFNEVINRDEKKRETAGF